MLETSLILSKITEKSIWLFPIRSERRWSISNRYRIRYNKFSRKKKTLAIHPRLCEKNCEKRELTKICAIFPSGKDSLPTQLSKKRVEYNFHFCHGPWQKMKVIFCTCKSLIDPITTWLWSGQVSFYTKNLVSEAVWKKPRFKDHQLLTMHK